MQVLLPGEEGHADLLETQLDRKKEMEPRELFDHFG